MVVILRHGHNPTDHLLEDAGRERTRVVLKYTSTLSVDLDAWCLWCLELTVTDWTGGNGPTTPSKTMMQYSKTHSPVTSRISACTLWGQRHCHVVIAPSFSLYKQEIEHNLKNDRSIRYEQIDSEEERERENSSKYWKPNEEQTIHLPVFARAVVIVVPVRRIHTVYLSWSTFYCYPPPTTPILHFVFFGLKERRGPTYHLQSDHKNFCSTIDRESSSGTRLLQP